MRNPQPCFVCKIRPHCPPGPRLVLRAYGGCGLGVPEGGALTALEMVQLSGAFASLQASSSRAVHPVRAWPGLTRSSRGSPAGPKVPCLSGVPFFFRQFQFLHFVCGEVPGCPRQTKLVPRFACQDQARHVSPEVDTSSGGVISSSRPLRLPENGRSPPPHPQAALSPPPTAPPYSAALVGRAAWRCKCPWAPVRGLHQS